MSHGIVPRAIAERTRLGIAPLARRLAALGLSADLVTLVGGALSVLGAVLLAQLQLVPALVALVLGALADTLDGQVAKVSGGGTPAGAFLDSTIDRISDSALFVGAVAAGIAVGQPAIYWSALAALVISSLIPYTRAKAESLGIRANVGLAPREARTVIVLIGLGFWAIFDLRAVFTIAVLLVAVLGAQTFVQRVMHVRRQLSIKGR